MNLRGTSGSVKIIIPRKNSVEKSIPVGYYQLHQKALYQLNSVLYEVQKFEKTKEGGRLTSKNAALLTKARERFHLSKPNSQELTKNLKER